MTSSNGNFFRTTGPFVLGIHRSPVNTPHKGQWRGALMLSLICVWINGWVNNCEAGGLRGHRAHYDVIVMWKTSEHWLLTCLHSSNAFIFSNQQAFKQIFSGLHEMNDNTSRLHLWNMEVQSNWHKENVILRLQQIYHTLKVQKRFNLNFAIMVAPLCIYVD